MTYALACYQSNTFAAIASVAGMMSSEAIDPNSSLPCNSLRPMPVMHFHGTSDFDVPIESGEEAVSYWRTFNGATESSSNTVQDGGRTIEHYSYSGGDAPVEYFKIVGGYHETFDNINYDGQNSLDLIWNFFANHDLNGSR